MKNFWFQTKMNATRLIKRDVKTFFFALFFPLFFYILYTRIFVFDMPEDDLVVWQTDYMISMILFGSLFTSVITQANTLLEDYTNHFQLFVYLTPTSKWRYFLSVNAVYVPINLGLIVALGTLAYFVNGVSLSLIQWLVLVIIVVFGTVPFSLLGIITSYGRKTTLVNLIGNLLVFPLAIGGGLWWPLEMMPSWVVSIGERLVTHQLLTLSTNWVYSSEIRLSSIAGIMLWILGLVTVIIVLQKLFKYRESEVT